MRTDISFLHIFRWELFWNLKLGHHRYEEIFDGYDKLSENEQDLLRSEMRKIISQFETKFIPISNGLYNLIEEVPKEAKPISFFDDRILSICMKHGLKWSKEFLLLCYNIQEKTLAPIERDSCSELLEYRNEFDGLLIQYEYEINIQDAFNLKPSSIYYSLAPLFFPKTVIYSGRAWKDDNKINRPDCWGMEINGDSLEFCFGRYDYYNNHLIISTLQISELLGTVNQNTMTIAIEVGISYWLSNNLFKIPGKIYKELSNELIDQLMLIIYRDLFALRTNLDGYPISKLDQLNEINPDYEIINGKINEMSSAHEMLKELVKMDFSSLASNKENIGKIFQIANGAKRNLTPNLDLIVHFLVLAGLEKKVADQLTGINLS